MNLSVHQLLVIGMLFFARVAGAVSISGILIYSSDDFGNPSGHVSLEGDQVDAHVWRTLLGEKWYGLFVWSGSQASVEPPALNADDLTVEIPLVEGENDFTVVGESGPLTTGDDYDRFALNLYFDGMLDRPGISVLFPRRGSPSGDPPTMNRAIFLVSLAGNRSDAKPASSYDNRVFKVEVAGMSFVGSGIDAVSPLQLGPSGRDDFVGVLKVMVEPSSSTSSDGCAVGQRSPTDLPAMPLIALLVLLPIWLGRE